MQKEKIKLIRIATIPSSINIFCKGLLKKIQNDYEVVAIASPGPEMEEIEKREGVKTISIPIERPISFMKDIISLIKIAIVFHKEKPYIVHGVVGGKGSFLAMIAGWLMRVPIRIYTFTGVGSVYKKGILGVILRTTNKISCFCATHVLPEGFGVKNDLEKYNITNKPLKVLGHGNIRGIDADYYRRTPEILNQAQNIKMELGGIFIFCFVGRIVADKGINELVEAFIKLSSEKPFVRLLLVGDFDDGLNPIKHVNKEVIETCKYIYAAGRKNDVRPWLAASDCFVLPSYREGVPNSPLEAGAMGLPSIVTDINGSREIVKNGENGLIIPPRDSHALYEAMQYMCNNKEHVEKMASNAREMVISRYEQNYVHQCLMDYYKEIIDKTNI